MAATVRQSYTTRCGTPGASQLLKKIERIFVHGNDYVTVPDVIALHGRRGLAHTHIECVLRQTSSFSASMFTSLASALGPHSSPDLLHLLALSIHGLFGSLKGIRLKLKIENPYKRPQTLKTPLII